MNTGILLRTFLLCIILTGIYSSSCKPKPQVDIAYASLDSLIQNQWINEKTFMVSFGADAITAINTEMGIVVVDAGISTGLTQKYRREIKQEFLPSRFIYIINAHAHHDHYRGNSVFPDAQIIGHENGPGEMEEYWKDPQQVEKSLERIVKEYSTKVQLSSPDSEDWHRSFRQLIRYQSAFEDAMKNTPIKKPDILFSDSLGIEMGDVTFELKYFGRCHSNSDILIHIPELKVLFVGDLMFRYGKPSLRDNTMTDKELWHKTIAWTEKRMDHIETVIGGHGQLLTRDDLQAFHRIILEKTL